MKRIAFFLSMMIVLALTGCDSNDLDDYEIGTHRTRVVAFLTQDQMLLSDMFDSHPDAYYIDLVKAKMDENLKYKK